MPADHPPPLPLALIGGWLGAGKTTLVNHLLRHAAPRRVAVLVNDFGSISIDADLIEGQTDPGVLSLAGGCLCCSFGDDLVGTLAALAQRDPRPDLALIELSGVALPAAVARTARLARGVQIAGTLVVADATRVVEQIADRHVGDTVRQQLLEGDWLLLNKPDLTDAATLDAARAILSRLVPAAALVVSPARDLPAELVLGWSAPPPPEADARPWVPRPIGARPHAAGLFESQLTRLPDGVDPAALAALLQRLAGADGVVAGSRAGSQAAPAGSTDDVIASIAAAAAAPASGGDPAGAPVAVGGRLLRAKGFVRDPQGRGWLVQFAGTRCELTPHDFTGGGRLVTIALRTPPQAGPRRG